MIETGVFLVRFHSFLTCIPQVYEISSVAPRAQSISSFRPGESLGNPQKYHICSDLAKKVGTGPCSHKLVLTEFSLFCKVTAMLVFKFNGGRSPRGSS